MIRVGLVGYGYWGPNLARNVAETPGLELAAISDLRPNRLELASIRHPRARTTENAEELTAASDLDALLIATPVASHFSLALSALQGGKHVLVEKPLSASTEEADRLIEEAERRNRLLMVDHTFIYTEAVRKIRQIVRSGDIGQVFYYDSVRINLGLFQHEVNVLWDLAVHDLAILDYVIGIGSCRVGAVAVSHLPGQPENTAYLTLLLEENVVAHVHVNWLAPVKIRRTIIGGNKKMIVYDDLEPSEKVKVYDRGVDLVRDEADIHRMLVSYRSGDMSAPKVDSSEALGRELAHFRDCMITGTRPLTDAAAGRRILRVLEAASESLADGGRLVPTKEGVLSHDQP